MVEQTNPKFEAYYKVRQFSSSLIDRSELRLVLRRVQAQNIVPEGEWEELLAAFRRPLPTTFRLTTSRPFVRYSVSRSLPITLNLPRTMQYRPRPQQAYREGLRPDDDGHRARRSQPDSSETTSMVRATCLRLSLWSAPS